MLPPQVLNGKDHFPTPQAHPQLSIRQIATQVSTQCVSKSRDKKVAIFCALTDSAASAAIQVLPTLLFFSLQADFYLFTFNKILFLRS